MWLVCVFKIPASIVYEITWLTGVLAFFVFLFAVKMACCFLVNVLIKQTVDSSQSGLTKAISKSVNRKINRFLCAYRYQNTTVNVIYKLS